MKRLNTLTVTAVLGFALLAGACGDGLADINENPNAPTDVPAPYLLPQAIQTTVEQFYGQWFNLEFAGLFAQHWAKIQYTDEDRYMLRPATIDGWWSALYAGSLKDWQTIIEKGEATGLANHEATGRVMKAFTTHVMTDIWGDMPYSEALRADDPENPITVPVYDAQADIYADMIAELGTALGLFNASATGWGSEDLIYGGDIAGWARFANSLRLRLAMRMSVIDNAAAQTVVNAAVAHAAGLITQNSQNATLAFLESPPNQNPLYENHIQGGRDDHAVSATLVDYMSALNDPRLAIYAEPAESDGVFRGMQNSVASADVPALPTLSRIGDYWRGAGTENAARPALLVTAAEVHFLLAEAAERGYNSPLGSAQQHYEAGVRAAMDLYAIPTAAVDAYLAQPGVAWGTGGSALELIIEQKWLALYTNGPEAYAEYRRTGFPNEITVGPDAAFSFVPGRVPYPDSEQSLNSTNWQAAISAQPNDGNYTGRVWWMPTP